MAEKSICHFGAKCNKGDRCLFAHPERGDSASASTTSKQPCPYGIKCKFGKKCFNDHSAIPVNVSEQKPKQQESSDSSDKDGHPSRASPATGPRPNKPKPKGKCRAGPNCNKQPDCQFDHTVDDEGTSSTLVPKLMKDIAYELERNLPVIREKHEQRIKAIESKLDDDDDDIDETIMRNLLEEHRAQLRTFNTTIRSYSQEPDPTNDTEAKYRLGAIRREIKRLDLHLPIYAKRTELLNAVRSNRILILKADTGSGKSTQLVQYLVDGGLANQGEIVCTQPRRLAARALASRVAEEFGCEVGQEVGYHIGATKPRISVATKIRFVTDSILLNEYIIDPKLSRYSIVVIDEAHERRVDTDLLFGIMKLCLRQRSDIKLIVMSATLDVKLLRDYYRNSALLEVPGRTYPIEDEYADEDIEEYIEAAIAKTIEIHQSKQPGDILVFLTGPNEIDRAVVVVEAKFKDSAVVLPLHGKLTEDDMKRIFEPTPAGKRKIIFSTNVAETSVTIDGVRHVVETGMVKESMWDEKRRMQVLKIGMITQSSVKQRRGRAGRTSPGKCYHLYTREVYDSLDVCPRAEILCIQPSLAVLKLKHLGVVDNIEQFDWLEAPPVESIREAVKSLQWLGALDPQTQNLTKTGRKMAELGLPPMLSAMIFKGVEMSCVDPVIIVAAMLTVAQNIWWRSKDPKAQDLANEKRAYFAHDNDQGGDHIQLLKIFLEWESQSRGKGQRNDWCRNNMVNGKTLNIALEFIHEVYRQLKKKEPEWKSITLDQTLIDQVLRCVTAGYFQNLALSNGPIKAGYQLIATENAIAQVYRTSTIGFAKQPAKYVVYHEILNLNGTNCMTVLCPIQYEWLPQAWLRSLPRQPADLVFVSHVYQNLGPLLMRACLGKRCVKKQQLEDLLGVVLDVNYDERTLTIWCQSQKLANAKSHLEQLFKVEREKLNKEVEEFDLIGSTRILLGAGGEPILVLTEGEYVKVIVKGLPTNVTEEAIEQKFRSCGKVRCVNIIQTSNEGTSAAVIYDQLISAQNATVRLTNTVWNGRNLVVSPSYSRTSAHTSSQNCKLEVRWFLTASECQGKLTFTQRESAEKAVGFLEQQFKCQCRLRINANNPTIRCQWPLQAHKGEAFLDFSNAEEARKCLQLVRTDQLKVLPSKNKDISLYIRKIPTEYDEEDLRIAFPSCQSVKLQYPTRMNQAENRDAIKETARRIFGQYQSFLVDNITLQTQSAFGRAEIFVEFTNEDDARNALEEMNGRTGYVDTGKIRLSSVKAPQTKKAASEQNEYVIQVSKLPPEIIEQDILNVMKDNHIADHLSYISVFRKKLIQGATNSNDTNLVAELNKLRNLFSSQKYFRSEPEVDIRPATDDGRVIALVIYNNPHDVTTAMKLYQDPTQQGFFRFDQYKLHLVPRNDHVIELHQALVKAIPEKIEQTIEDCRRMNLLTVKVFKKEISKKEKKITRIHIQGPDNLEIVKVRAVFDRLMQGLEFRFYQPSWTNILFSAEGKKFLSSLEKSTKTYIWWNWSSTFLRIYGTDHASNAAYRKIDEFIQKRLRDRKETINVSIPQGLLRQCLRNTSTVKELSAEDATIEIDIRKRVIRISGDDHSVKICENRVRQYLATLTPDSSSKATTAKNECPLCCDTCEFPYALQECGHVYCRSCLMNFFESKIDPTLSLKEYQLVCLVDQCGSKCLIRDIKSILGAEKTPRLAKIALQIYLRQPKVDLAQCFGIDCNQVYRPSNNKTQYTCDQCVKNYCISCRTECHEGVTCEEHQRLMAKQRDEKLLRDNLGLLPFKKCPKCTVLIEKYAGCNAVKCTQCTIAFCWLCDKTDPVDAHAHFYDQSTPCYNKTFT